MKIAVVDKSPNNVRYQKHFELFDHEVETFFMASEKVTGRLLKKHITIGTPENPFNPEVT